MIRWPTFNKGYEIKRFLGSGHFGDVYLGTKEGWYFAIKKVVNTERRTAKEEIQVLKQVNHRHIIKYFDHYLESSVHFCIVLEYADRGTMGMSVKKHVKEEWNVWRTISHLADALDYLHSRNPQVLHHNLKPENILGVSVVARPPETGLKTMWKLADFGVAKMLTRQAQEVYYGGDAPGIPTYMGPEVLKDFETYSAVSDIWSLGLVIAFYIRNGKHVFESNDDVFYYKSSMAADLILDVEEANFYSTTLLQMIFSMLQVENQHFERHLKMHNTVVMCSLNISERTHLSYYFFPLL